MDEVSARIVIVAGVWLLIYQAGLRTPLRKGIVILTQFFAGASLLILEPLVETESLEHCLILGVVAGALSLCSWLFSTILSSISLGVGLTQWLLNLTLCSSAGDDLVLGLLHIALATIVSLVISLFFIFKPLFVEIVLWPLLGAMLVATGYSALLAEPDRSRINPFPGTCPGSTGQGFEALAAWLFVGLLASAIQLNWAILRIQRREAEKEESSDALNQPSKTGALTSLLQTSRANLGDDAAPGFNKPEGDLSRVHAICRCIPEGSDMSHLSENEKKLVEICRTDSFERDRILFGGGLC